MTKLLATGLAVAVMATAFLGVAFLGQRSVLFPAPRSPAGPSRDAEVIRLALPAGVVEALFLTRTSGGAGPAPLLIFAHGNGELADDWVDEFAEPRSSGWAVLLVEYPGYGRSAGSPSERSINAATAAAYNWARGDGRVDSHRIVAYGRSLGGGAASRLAADQQLAGLILESSFTSVRPLAARFLVPGFLVRDPFDNLAALGHYRGPLLVLHGRDDAIIPVTHGRELAAAVPGAEYHELSCGHNDCPRQWAVINSFLTAHGLAAAVSSAGPTPNPSVRTRVEPGH